MRVRRTFAFLDLSGFSALTEADGDERAVAVLTVFRAALRDVCSRRGVRIAKWLGDGAMLVCVETTPLVAATLEMQWALDAAPENVAMRAGITSGSVILLEGDDYVGHAVNVAARLCDLAPSHQVLALATVRPDLPRWAVVETADEVSVRGLEHPVEVIRLCLPRPGPDTSPDPVCQIPLTDATAATRGHDADGCELLFCSESCAEVWRQRQAPAIQETGSIREVWMR